MSDDRFPASIRRYHQQTMSNVMGRLQHGQVFSLTPQEFQTLGDLAGALNYYAAQSEPLPPAPTLPVRVLDIVWPTTGSVVFQLSPGEIVAIPLAVPAFPYQVSDVLSASSAEYGAAPALRVAAVNVTAGDLTGAQQGVQATVDVPIAVGGRIPPGSICYYNVRLADGHPATQSRFYCTFPH